jgi:REP-associated tyrosine transposase
MPDYVRWRASGAAYFFTVVAHRQRRILIEPIARRCLRCAIKIVQSRWLFNTYAFVLLPDHRHCIWQLPEDDDNYPIRWKGIKFVTEFQGTRLEQIRFAR